MKSAGILALVLACGSSDWKNGQPGGMTTADAFVLLTTGLRQRQEQQQQQQQQMIPKVVDAAPSAKAFFPSKEQESMEGLDSVSSSSPDASRRSLLRQSVLVAAAFAIGSKGVAGPEPAWAKYVLDDETGEYVEVEEVDWQTAWKQRMDKASTMSKDEIFQAARGAGNVDLREGPESDASKKRRAMSACRDPKVRSQAQAGSEKECTARVFGGEVDFLLEQL